MNSPNVKELLAAYSPEELAKILREELDAVGISYTCNSEDTFNFCPISIDDFDSYSFPVPDDDMQWKGKAICNSSTRATVESYSSQNDNRLSDVGYLYKSTISARPDTTYDRGYYPAA